SHSVFAVRGVEWIQVHGIPPNKNPSIELTGKSRPGLRCNPRERELPPATPRGSRPYTDTASDGRRQNRADPGQQHNLCLEPISPPLESGDPVLTPQGRRPVFYIPTLHVDDGRLELGHRHLEIAHGVVEQSYGAVEVALSRHHLGLGPVPSHGNSYIVSGPPAVLC